MTDVSRFDIRDGVLVRYTGTESAAEIPGDVKEIDGDAFRRNHTLVSLTIPGHVKKIGAYAFADCRNLAKATLGEGVESVGMGAFEECRSLQSIELPDSVRTLGNFVFAECAALSSVKLPAGLEAIPYYAFRGCVKLEHILFPGQLKEIRADAFRGCRELKSVYLSGAANVSWAFEKTTDVTLYDGTKVVSRVLVPTEEMWEMYEAYKQGKKDADESIGLIDGKYRLIRRCGSMKTMVQEDLHRKLDVITADRGAMVALAREIRGLPAQVAEAKAALAEELRKSDEAFIRGIPTGVPTPVPFTPRKESGWCADAALLEAVCSGELALKLLSPKDMIRVWYVLQWELFENRLLAQCCNEWV